MAHAIKNRNDMVYNAQNGTPWHGLGIAATGAMTSADVLELASQYFTPVEVEPAYTGGGKVIPGQFVTVQNGEPLGVIGKDYRVLQNLDVLSVLDSLTETGGVTYETVGLLRGGQDFWALARIGEGYDITGHGDKVKPYVLVSNNHTNKRRGRMQLTTIRVVCANTEGFARKQADADKDLYRPVSFGHTGDVLAKLETAAAFMGIAKKVSDEQAELFTAMSKKVLTMADAEKLLETVYPSTEGAKRDHNKVERELITMLWEGGGAGSDMKGVRGTLWGLYNAATEAVNHWHGSESKRDESERLSMKFETLQLTSAAQRLNDITLAFAGAL